MSSKLSPKKRENAVKLKKSDMDFYRMSAMFFLLCGVLLLILKVSTTIAVRQSTGRNMGYELYKLFRHPAYIAFVGILLAASIVWVIVCRVKKINEHDRVFSSINALALMLYVTGFSLFFGVRIVNNASSCTFALAATIILALLYYISKFYHRDFLLFSIENALLALLLYRYWPIYTARGIVGKILLIVAFCRCRNCLCAVFEKMPDPAAPRAKERFAAHVPVFCVACHLGGLYVYQASGYSR